MPLCHARRSPVAIPAVAAAEESPSDNMPPSAYMGYIGSCCNSNNGCGMSIISLSWAWIGTSNVSHVFRLRASNPQPEYPSRSSISTSTPLPHPISTKPGNGLCLLVGPSPSPSSKSFPASYISFHSSIKKAAMPRSSKTCLLGSVFSTQRSHSL